MFEACGARRSWVISCTRWSKLARLLTLTFDLLTWKSIGIICSIRTIYLPSLKLLGQSVLELSVAQGEVNWHDLWPTDLKINRDHLLTRDYLPTKFEVSGAKRYWVISCTRLRDTDIPTYRPTDQPTDRCKAICPPFSKGGGGIIIYFQILLVLLWTVPYHAYGVLFLADSSKLLQSANNFRYVSSYEKRFQNATKVSVFTSTY